MVLCLQARRLDPSPVQSIPAMDITGHWGEDGVRKGHPTRDLWPSPTCRSAQLLWESSRLALRCWGVFKERSPNSQVKSLSPETRMETLTEGLPIYSWLPVPPAALLVLQWHREQKATSSLPITDLSSSPILDPPPGKSNQLFPIKLPPQASFFQRDHFSEDRCVAMKSLRDCDPPCLPLASYRDAHPWSREQIE